MNSTAFLSNGQSISAELIIPSSGTEWPSVVVAYGTEAMNSPFDGIIRDFCSELAVNGLLAMIPDYFASTKTGPGLESVFQPFGAQQRFDHWVAALNDAVSHVQTISGVAAGHTAFVGFSLGGHLVVRAAAGPSVKAVVDFFGFMAKMGSSVTSTVAGSLRPVQIHHGEDDRIVPIADSVTFDGWLTAHSVSHEFHRYPNNGHPGQEKFEAPGWTAQADATTKAVHVAAGLIVVVAFIHLAIVAGEMFPTEHPLLLSKLENKLGFADGQAVHASPIVRNAGLYNGFLAAGLIWGWRATSNQFQIRAFFLACVTIAGIFGALTLPNPVTLWMQTLPAVVAFIVNWFALRSEINAVARADAAKPSRIRTPE
ncbi:MAG: DUF1304 family protein [Planctomycetota bacterium]|nr:DUF1304 family protein [Planctomycetota bacterium]